MRTILFGPMLKGAALKKVLKRIQYSEKKDFRLAVDGGLSACRSIGVASHFAIGDWDGLEAKDQKSLRNVAHLTLPTKKDQSDLYHGLRMARMLGASELVAVGFDGGRVDHALGVIFEMSVAARDLGFKSVMLEGTTAHYQWLTPGMGKVELPVKKGALFSIFAPLGQARGWALEGAEYGSTVKTLIPGTLGLSNQRKGSAPVKMKVKGGVLLTVIPVLEKSR